MSSAALSFSTKSFSVLNRTTRRIVLSGVRNKSQGRSDAQLSSILSKRNIKVPGRRGGEGRGRRGQQQQQQQQQHGISSSSKRPSTTSSSSSFSVPEPVTLAVAAKTLTQQQQRQRFSFNFFRWYSKQLDTNPIRTKCLTAGAIGTAGNILAQKITHDRAQKEAKENNGHQQGDDETPLDIDWSAVGRFAFLNVAFVAPVLHHWYRWVNARFPGTSLKAVSTRVFWDEGIFTPVYLPFFMGGLWTLEGKYSPSQIVSMLRKEMPNIIMAEWVLWVPTMFCTFRFVPVKYQVLAINVVGVAWQTFLSLIANNQHQHQHNNGNEAKEVSQMEAKSSMTNNNLSESVVILDDMPSTGATAITTTSTVMEESMDFDHWPDDDAIAFYENEMDYHNAH